MKRNEAIEYCVMTLDEGTVKERERESLEHMDDKEIADYLCMLCVGLEAGPLRTMTLAMAKDLSGMPWETFFAEKGINLSFDFE